MATLFGGYEPITPFVTVGSGSARWCVARKEEQNYFVKEFLSPVCPLFSVTDSLYEKRLARSVAFERQKKRLYSVLAGIQDEHLVPVIDFFRHRQRYYAASELIEKPYQTLTDLFAFPMRTRLAQLRALVSSLQHLSGQGIVHADLKPEHVLLQMQPDQTLQMRLIDFDGSFMQDDPPKNEREITGDPVYLAPETYLCMIGEKTHLSSKLDVFALGILFHQALAGELPSFDRQHYSYLYEVVLENGGMTLSPSLPLSYRELIARMLSRSALDRPDYSTIDEWLEWGEIGLENEESGAMQEKTSQNPLFLDTPVPDQGLEQFWKGNLGF